MNSEVISIMQGETDVNFVYDMSGRLAHNTRERMINAAFKGTSGDIFTDKLMVAGKAR